MKIETARVGLQAISTGLTTTVFELQKELISAHLASFQWIALGLAVAFVALLVGKAFNVIVSKSWLLRRAIMGANDMEGDWINLAVDKATGEMINIAFTKTTYRDGHFRYDGRAWNLTTDRTNYWRTLQSDYSDDKLTFRYETWRAGSAADKIQGSGIICFTREHNRITGYTGEFVDVWHLRECVNVGEKLRYSFRERRKLTEMEMRERAEARLDERLAEFLRELGIRAKTPKRTR